MLWRVDAAEKDIPGPWFRN